MPGVSSWFSLPPDSDRCDAAECKVQVAVLQCSMGTTPSDAWELEVDLCLLLVEEHIAEQVLAGTVLCTCS